MSLPYNLRLRPDLIIRPHDTSRGTWVVKDPIALRFFLFGADEHFIMQRLDGRQSAQQILAEFTRERAPRRMTSDRLQQFLAALHRNGLACSDSPGQSSLLQEREGCQRWRESVLGWTNLLAIRFPGVDPDAWLDLLYPAIRWCFSWWFLAGCTLIWMAAVGLILAEVDAMRAQWPQMVELVSGQNIIWLAVALAATKIIHELSHAFVCKHFGGRCHELGFMLLVFTPCLYCNVTDAWMLRSRWQRIAISAAGILMELQLAAVAVIVWWYTQPGILHSICLNVVIVCSVGTILFNGNPLLKYDGYYILSDLVGIPNLWQESRSYLYGWLGAGLLGRTATSDIKPRLGGSFLIAYAGASIVYRFCITVAILLFVYRALHPKGFDLILLLVASGVTGQMLISWAAPFAQWQADPARWQRLNKFPLAFLLVAATAVLVASFCSPLQCDVTAPAVLQPSAVQRVYITTPGMLLEAASAGDQVGEGHVLAELDNADLRMERIRIAGDLSRAKARVRSLEARQGDESGAAAELRVARAILDDLTQQSLLREEEARSLTLLAPVDGTVIPPPAKPIEVDGQELSVWTGTPLDRENRGCQLERGSLFCLVGDAGGCDAVVFVDEIDMPYVRIGQQARIRLKHAVTEVLTARVVEIAEINAESAPAELAVQQDLAVRRGDSGTPVPIRTKYQVRLKLDVADTPKLIGARGMAKIRVEPQTIAERIVRCVRRTLTIDPVPWGAN